ncbi:MAG TPA: SufS family cysteine desulfurase [Acidimicrobiales bacterium]|nr:SufS family cysteine desulfurase [Acidimicrobiales bacterium]
MNPPVLDPRVVRKDFPILADGKLVYLDSASSSQKPTAVLDAMTRYYETTHANVHRGVYTIAEEATREFEEARSKVAAFLGGRDDEIVFTKNVTEAANLFVHSWGRSNLKPGDVVLLTQMEHHAMLVPWLMLAPQLGVELRYLDVTDDGYLDLSDLDAKLQGVKFVGVTAASNVLGTITPIRQICDAAHAVGAVVFVDGAQSAPHVATDVAALGCDAFGWTGHKMLGPTGIGGLWARKAILEAIPPFLGGGEMIRDVRLDGFETNDVPWKFEAGTPPIAEAIGLGAAIDYINALGIDAIRRHEIEVTQYAFDAFRDRFGTDANVHGPHNVEHRTGVFSFAYKDVHPHDLAQVLDQHGVCVRAGHHCAKPLMRCLSVPATARASFYVYNDTSDVDALLTALAEADAMFC